MMILAVASLLAVASATTMTQFAEFTSKFNKVYTSSEEFQIRYRVFERNLAIIAEQNRANVAAGGEADVFAVNEFSDLTPAEFKATYLMTEYSPVSAEADGVDSFASAYGANVTIDWRTRGVLTPVKNQGRCGSCWAFSATSAIESYAHLAGRPLQVLSPQQITSCDKVDHGCNGGRTETAFAYIVRAGGLQSEASYPYTSGGTGQSGTCHAEPSKFVQKITGYRSVARGETNLAGALEKGPVSICLGASSWQSYHGGVMRACPGPVDHCVQLVGYDAPNNAWIIRNQWGTSWGESGYLRLARGNNLCNVAGDATYPTF
jgi:C1A family cysteine protease